jgi:hypothetical protein
MSLKVINKPSAILLLLFSYSLLAQAQKARQTDLITVEAGTSRWGLKNANNSICERQGVERAYYVSDLGSSFGRTGGVFSRTRNDVDGYARSKFIRRVNVDRVDFVFKTRPEFFLILYPPYYSGRARLEKVARDIPRADARRIGELLKQLSPDQIANAFRAAGYTPEQVSGYARKISERIAELTKL